MWWALLAWLLMGTGFAQEKAPRPSGEHLVVSQRGGLGYGSNQGLKMALHPGISGWFGPDPRAARMGVTVDWTRALAFWNVNWSAYTVGAAAQSPVWGHMRIDAAIGGGTAHLWDTDTCWDCDPPTIRDATLRGVMFGAVGWQLMTVDSPSAVHWGVLARVSALRSIQEDPRGLVVVTGGGCVAF